MAEFLNNVYTSFTQVVILFLVAAVGFICHKTGIYTEKASRLTTNLLFYMVAPAIIIRSFYGMDYSRDSIKGLLMALLGGILFHVVGMIFATVLFNKKGQETASIFKYACCYGNVGYMALPLAQAILGDEGVFYCSVILVPFNILSFTHGVGIMQKKDEKEKINIKKLSETAKLPERGSAFAAGYDLFADLQETIEIKPHETYMINTGVAMEIPEGYWGGVFARSGLSAKEGLRPANCVGVVDADYRGPVCVALYNDSEVVRKVAPQQKIAQLVVVPFLAVEFEEVAELSDTVRGAGGFGSTGK